MCLANVISRAVARTKLVFKVGSKQTDRFKVDSIEALDLGEALQREASCVSSRKQDGNCIHKYSKYCTT
jgi:hypothetical protein